MLSPLKSINTRVTPTIHQARREQASGQDDNWVISSCLFDGIMAIDPPDHSVGEIVDFLQARHACDLGCGGTALPATTDKDNLFVCWQLQIFERLAK